MGTNNHEINAITMTPGNNQCADCGCHMPRWVSINLGVLVCIECSGMHRKLGVHISKIKSLSLDAIKSDWIRVLKSIGNEVANYYYLRNLPSDVEPIRSGETAARREMWIRNKYEHKLYAATDLVEPCILVSQGKKPRKVYGMNKKMRSISQSESFADFSNVDMYNSSANNNFQLSGLDNNDVNFANFDLHARPCPVEVNNNPSQPYHPNNPDLFANKPREAQLPNLNDVNKNRDAKIDAAKACISKLYKNPEQLGLSPRTADLKPNCLDDSGNIDFTKLL